MRNWQHVYQSPDGDDDGGAAGGEGDTGQAAGAGNGADAAAAGFFAGHDDSGDDAGAAGNPNAHPAQGSGTEDGAQQGANGEQGAAEGERPEYLPEAFWDAETASPRVEQLAKSLNDTKAALTKAQQTTALDKDAPETAEAYLKDWAMPEPPEGMSLDKIGPVSADDVALKAFAEIAKENGFSKSRFDSTVVKFMAAINEHMPETAPPVDMAAEGAKLGTPEQAKAAIATAFQWVSSMGPRADDKETGRQPVLSAEEAAEISKLDGSAAGIKALLKLRELSGERPIPSGGSLPVDGALSQEECYAMMGEVDEKSGQLLMDMQGPKGDAHRKKVDDAFAKAFGTGVSGSAGRIMPRGMQGNS